MVLGEFKKKVMEEIKIGVVGLGYVGLPLARLFATKYAVVGFDLKKERIEALNRGIDRTLEVSEEVMKSVLRPSVPKRGEKGLYCSCDPEDLRDCNYYIITVPTPVDKHNRPDLTPLIRASETVGQVIVRGDIVIYESTVYPGATEEDCIPVIERVSGLKYNVDFFAGYSPERINPGDKQHTVEKIKKVTSGSTPGVAEKVNALYHSVIVAGTHLAPSIRVAEAAKDNRKFTAGYQYRLCQRIVENLQFNAYRYTSCARSCRYEVEFFILPARLGRRTLYRCGSLLFGPESSGIRIPSGNYPGRTQTERQYGRVCGQTNVEVYDPERTMYQGI